MAWMYPKAIFCSMKPDYFAKGELSSNINDGFPSSQSATSCYAFGMNKLPEITAAFWLMKISATTLGEIGGDWLSMTMNLGYLASSIIFFGLFAVALGAQLASTRHHPFLY